MFSMNRVWAGCNVFLSVMAKLKFPLEHKNIRCFLSDGMWYLHVNCAYASLLMWFSYISQKLENFYFVLLLNLCVNICMWNSQIWAVACPYFYILVFLDTEFTDFYRMTWLQALYPPVFTFQTCPFCYGFWGLNSAPYTCTTSLSMANISAVPVEVYFK